MQLAIYLAAFLVVLEQCSPIEANQTLQAQPGPFPTWNCDRATCQSLGVPLGDMKVVNVAVEMEDFVLVYGEGYKFLGVASRGRKFAATNCVLDNLKMLISASRNVSIIIHDGTSYVLDQRRVGLSFESPTEVIRAFYEMYDNQATPFIKQISAQDEGFDMRQVLVYLAKHGSIRGAPTLTPRLERKLLEYFGDELDDVARLYQQGEVAVGDYEAVFYYLVIGGKGDYPKLYNYVASLALNQILTDPEIPTFLTNFTKFQSYGTLHKYATHLYPSKEDSIAAFNRGTFQASTGKLGEHYKFHFALDVASGSYVSRLESNDGLVDTYTTYHQSLAAWTFHCRLTGFLLVFPRCPHFALYNARVGFGAVAFKSTNVAQIIHVDHVHYRKNRFYQAISFMTLTTCGCSTPGTFNFNQFLNHAHILGTTLFLPCKLGVKQQLKKYFGNFVKAVHFIDGYDGTDGSANAVLYFFKGTGLKTLRVDRRKMVSSIATRNSTFYTDAMMAALFYYDMEKLSK